MGAFFVRTGSPNTFNLYGTKVETYATATIDGTQVTLNGNYYCSWEIDLKASVAYYIKYTLVQASSYNVIRFQYTDGTLTDGTYTNGSTFTPTKNVKSVLIYCGLGTTQTAIYKDICINISNPLINGNYYPYVPNSRMQIADWHSNVPSGYVEVEYLESNGTQYIDTGIKPQSITPIVYLHFKTKVVGGGGSGLFGSYETNARFQIYNSSVGIGTYVSYVFQNFTDYKIVLDGANLTAKINDTNITSGFTNGYTTNAYNMYLFTRNQYNVADTQTPMLLYSCQIYDNTTLVRDFIPAVRLSDGEAGLYDKVNDVFYTNAGTGKFNYGKFKNIPSGYAQIDLGTLNWNGSSGTYYVGVSSLMGTVNLNLFHTVYYAHDGGTSGDNSMQVANGNLIIRSNAIPSGWLLYKKA